jgi:fumarate reductase flavoprotein subunit
MALSGRAYTEAASAESRGVKIRLGTQVSWIWRKDMDSPIFGVEVMKGNKRTNIKVKKGLILASGGFSRDVRMRMAFNPALVPEFNCTNQPGATGEIIRYAQAVGADALHLAFIQLFPFAEPESGILDTFATYPAKGVGYGFIYINKFGKRFVDEMERRDVVAYAQIKTGVKPTYSIFNRVMMQKMAGEKELEAGVRKGRFIQGDTITELAGKLGIPGETLQDTISKCKSRRRIRK